VTGTDAQRKTTLEARGVPVPANTFLYKTPARVTALDADIQDAIDDGVIVISSAGNSYWNCATAAAADYNNSVEVGGTLFHSRGSSPGAADNVICVGSLGVNTQEYKSDFSNYGSRVDIWAPGSNIVSAVYDTTAASEFGITLVNDPRNASFRLGSISGTSMSSPQVTGCVACLTENQPSLTQSEALTYLIANCKTGQIGSTGGVAGDYTSLGDSSNNRHLFYRLERALSGNVAINTYKIRSSTGAAYPRTRIRRFG
jgi:subtilisin family serine protease